MKYIWLSLFLFQFFPGNKVFSQSSNETLAGEWIHSTTMNAVTVNGNYAYCGAGKALYVLDIAAPTMNSSSVRARGEAVVANTINWIKVANSKAYVATGDSGLRIVNISNPYQPTNMGFKYTNGKAKCVDVSGNYAYVAADTAGVRIIDVSNPNAPNQVSYFDLGNTNANAVFVSGNYAYIAYGSSGFRIIDISNPLSPVAIGTLNWNNFTPQNVFVLGNYAYVIDDSLHIINISNPALPVQVGIAASFNFTFGNSIFAVGNYLYITEPISFGYSIWNVSNPSVAIYSGQYMTGVNSNWLSQSISVFGNTGYFIDDNSSPYVCALDIVNVSNPNSTTLIAKFPQPEYNADVCTIGNYVYVLGWTAPASGGMISVYDITNPLFPTQTAAYDDTTSTGGGSEIVSQGNYLYMSDTRTGVGNSNGFKIIDVSNPYDPLFAGKFNINNATCKGIAVAGNFAYCCYGNQGFKVVNISNPALPVQVGAVNLSGGFQAVEVFVNGNYTYVTDNASKLHIVNVSNPNLPVDIANCNLPANGTDVQVSGNYAYVECGTQGLRIIDVSNPNAPSIVGSYPSVSVGSQKLFYKGNMVYIGDASNGLQAIDVTIPSAPVQYGYYYGLDGLTRNVFADNLHIYLVSDHGLYIFNDAFLTSTNNSSITENNVKVYPNPANGIFTISSSTPLKTGKLKIYNSIGGLILEKNISEQTTHVDISNSPAGIYFIDIILPEGIVTRKIVLE